MHYSKVQDSHLEPQQARSAHAEDSEEFVEEVATQVLKHLKKFRTTSDAIKVVGLEGAEWHQYSNEDIQDDVEVDVEYFAAPKTDPDLMRQQKLQVFQLAVQSLPVLAQTGAPNTFDMEALVGWVLESFPQKDIGRFFRPAQQQLPEMQVGVKGDGGMTASIGGMFAPAPIPQQPGFATPGEGMASADLMQS